MAAGDADTGTCTGDGTGRRQPGPSQRRGTAVRAIAALAAAALCALGMPALQVPAAASAGDQSSTAATTVTGADAPTPHTVTFDKYSLMLDGKRTFIWSGEFHYWRLPSPDLWRDMLQKMKAEGYNAISIYFDWAYHSPAAGQLRLHRRPRRRQAARHRAGGRAST